MPITKVACAECGKMIRITNAERRGKWLVCKRCATDEGKGRQFPSEGK